MPSYLQIKNYSQYICIFFALTMCFFIRKKKQEITNSLRNTSYSQISIWILNLVFVNLIVYSILTFNGRFGESSSSFLGEFDFMMGAITRIISFTQMFEWMSMRAIIIWQSTKDLKEALFSLNDQNNLISYQKIENKIQKVWLLCCGMTFGICLCS